MSRAHPAGWTPDGVDLRCFLAGFARSLVVIARAMDTGTDRIDQAQGRLVHRPDDERSLAPFLVHGHLDIGLTGDALAQTAANAQPLRDNGFQSVHGGRWIIYHKNSR